MRNVEDFHFGPNADIDVSLQTATSFSNEYMEQLALADSASFGARAGEAARAALRLFDGDKPLEVGGASRGRPRQDWVIAMNLAADFGNECTIEKRTKKLQELAAETRGKPVTIVVQFAVKQKDGACKLERFALNDGKVVKIESPGRSGGYASDVEQLLKFTNQNYQTRNLGLILDSHGTGNGGMSGDTGSLSLTELRDSVTRGLRNSGHHKLDLLQFNACLMGQNGVLESTQSIARHIVASAEPEGTGAQGRDFDNRVFRELLRNPSMTAGDLADVGIRQATDMARDFPTLAHFDMEKYGKFRESLDAFGEKMAKLCKDPAQLAVIQNIIRETFAYGGGSIKFLNLFLGGGKDNPFLGKPLLDFAKPPTPPMDFSKPPVGFGKPPLGGLGKPPWDGVKPPIGGDWGFPGDGSSGFRAESGRRDVKDFVARVLLAISKGQLKDEDGSLEKAAKSLLIDGTALVKSFFADGKERMNTGGLSAFLPTSAHDDGFSDPMPSNMGGWRQFQQALRDSLGKAPAIKRRLE